MAEETVIEKIEEKAKAIPRKYWIIGGIVLLLLFLFLRKKRLVAQAQSEQSAATDGLTAAMSLPGGLQFAPITSGVSGGTGNNADSFDSLFGTGASNALNVGDVAQTTAPATTSNAASVTYSANASNQPTAPVNNSGGLIIGGPTGQFISTQQIKDFFALNPSNAQIATKAAELHMTSGEIAQAYSIGTGAAYNPVAVYQTQVPGFEWQDSGRLINVGGGVAAPSAPTTTSTASPTPSPAPAPAATATASPTPTATVPATIKGPWWEN